VELLRRPYRGARTGRLLLLLTLAALEAGCAAYSKRDVFHFNHSFAVDDPAFRRSLDTFGTVMVGGNQVDSLVNGDQIFPAMLKAIDDAKETINFESYIFKDDAVGVMFAKALEAAARRGVEVRLLVDAVGSPHLGNLDQEMNAAGIKVRVFHRIRLWTITKLGERTHRKLMVVDGVVSFTGGVGIEIRWLGDARNSNEWRDTEVRAIGPVAAQTQAIFAEDWVYTTGEILVGSKYYPRIERAGDIEAQAIKASRGDSASLAKMLYYVSLVSAVKSFRMQNAYFLPDKQVREALIAAVQRGVDVKIMVPGRHIDVAPVRLASQFHYGELLNGGVKLYEYNGTMMHAKNAIVDGLFSTVGSINFDARSFSKNAEENLVVYDRGFADLLEQQFQEDLKHCHQISLRQWEKRGIKSRFFELLSRFFQPLY
jgi:cardiolipin synthase